MAFDEWTSFSLKNDIMEIAEEVAPLYRTRVTDDEGNPARFISVQNIQYEETNLGDIIEYHIEMYLLSDQGQLVQPFLLKEFKDQSVFQAEVMHFASLDQRCSKFPDIGPESMIHYNTDKRYLIYDKIQGQKLNQLTLRPENADFLKGRISAVLHGGEVMQLDENVIRELSIFLLMNLKSFTDEEKVGIADLLERQFSKISGSTGGYAPCTQFSTNDFSLVPINKSQPIDFELINQGKAFLINIPSRTPENLTNDRLSDIASLFHESAFNEYIETGDVILTKQDIDNFLQGYSGVTNELQIPSLIAMYPNGSTFDLQFIISSWLFEAEKINPEIIDVNDFERREILRYTYFLLMDEPFSDLLQ